MDKASLKELWHRTLTAPSEAGLNNVANSVLDRYVSEARFREHVKNRSKRVTERTGVKFDPKEFGIESARAYVADEIGFTSWNDLISAVDGHSEKSILFCYAIAAMDRGDFSALESAIGTEHFYDQIVEWFESGKFDSERETLNEILSAACMLGQTRTAEFLIDHGVDPYAGMRSWLAGPHYAVSSGRLDTLKMLLEKNVPLEIENKYGGTLLGQALWSAINEHTETHAEIVERLIEAGALVWLETLEWWKAQDVPDRETKERIKKALARHAEFQKGIADAEDNVTNAEAGSDKRLLADALKALGNLLRRPTFLRDQANAVYERAADIYKEIGIPIEEAWVKRHIGINHEYAGRLEEAEKFYDEALRLYREHSVDDLNYANAVRYPAVIKNRLGKRDESRELWEEACRRYENVHPNGLGEGVAEAAAWLTIFALEKNDVELANKWFDKASEASSRSNDTDTHAFIEEVRNRLKMCKNS